MRITKRQLKRIIKEEKRRLIEAGDFYDEHDMEAAESADLYTNISDQEASALDELENCVWDCIEGGCTCRHSGCSLRLRVVRRFGAYGRRVTDRCQLGKPANLHGRIDGHRQPFRHCI